MAADHREVLLFPAWTTAACCRGAGSVAAWVKHPSIFFNRYAAVAIDDEWTPVAHGDTWLNAWGASAPWLAPWNLWLVEQKSYRVGDK